MLVHLSSKCEQLSASERDQTADFKWDKTTNFENETKPANIEKERNDQFFTREQLAIKIFLWEENVSVQLSTKSN